MFSNLASPFHSFKTAILSPSPAGRARLCLTLLGFLQIVFLITADKPWSLEADRLEKPRLEDHVMVYTWIATLFNFLATVMLSFTAGWWTAPLPALGARPPALVTPRWFWPLVAGAVVLTAYFAVPRMNDSLWDDEDYNVRYSIFGRFQRSDETGGVKFKKLSWRDTFYDYREPNNHVLHSLLARSSLEIWRAFKRPAGFPFEEWPLRIPALLFGLGAVVAVGWFGKEFFGPATGAIAAWLMAMHPWLVRYASEARGYSMVLCLLPIAFVLWRRCLVQGDWKWWAAYAVVQWAAIYTYPGVLFALAMLNVLALPLMAYSPGTAKPLNVQMGRWFAANGFSAMAVLQLMLPLYPQAKAYLAYESSRNFSLGWSWVQSTLSFLAVGVPWAGELPHYSSLSGTFSAHPSLLPWVVAGLAGLLALGFVRFLRKDPITAALAFVIVIPPMITFGVSVARHHLIYSSYVIYLLPGLVVFAAAAIAWLPACSARIPGGKALSALAPAVFLAAFFLLTSPTRNWLASHPLQPTRDAVLASRGTLDPWDENARKVLTASFCIPPYLYDGNMLRLNSTREFIELLRRADRERKTLVLNIGMPWAARAYSPKMWELFENPALFQNRLHLRGFDAGLDRIVATYIPGSAENFDFSNHEGPGR